MTYDVAVQADGKILIAGDVTTLSPNGGPPVSCGHLARLNPDGTVDAAFNPNANGIVSTVAIQPDGKILAGGFFSFIGGKPRSCIARLDPITGAADPSFNPNATNVTNTYPNYAPQVYKIVVQPDGNILVGGMFNNIGGKPRNGMARLKPNNGMADTFDPDMGAGSVNAITLQADGKVLAGGWFGSVSGQTRYGLARLDPISGFPDSLTGPQVTNVVNAIVVQPDGMIVVGAFFSMFRLDPISGSTDPTFNPSANSVVRSLALQADGKILAGGDFTSIGGQTRNRIARLDPSTGLADSFDPNANNRVTAIAVQADRKVVLGGQFSGPNSMSGKVRNRIARVDENGRLDQSLDLNTIGTYVVATAVQPDGKFLIGGLFSSVLGLPRNNMARLNSDGTLDTAFDPNANGRVSTIALQPDGQILAGGVFTSIGGQPRNRIARLDATTGAADLSFNPSASGSVDALALQSDGKIVVSGQFFGANSIGGQSRDRIARLNPGTGLADSFNPGADRSVISIAVQTDGKILAGGTFTSIGGQARQYIARLNPTTGLADSFNPSADDYVLAIALQADGKILAGGQFTNIGGQARSYLARLNAITGAADLSFAPNPNDWVFTVGLQADGEILAGGRFTFIGGQPRSYIARLLAPTGLADTFNPSANSSVFSIAPQADGKVLTGGLFSYIGGQPRNLFARLSNNFAALQNLAVTQNALSWVLGGSNPQYTRVAFEYSINNSNFTSLGDGTQAASSWTLTGLSLPTLQNINIRARGYYRSGYQNGSESSNESVREVYLSKEPPCPATFSENFDGNQPVPKLPPGWTPAATGAEVPWVTSTVNPFSAPKDAFAPDVAGIGNTELISPLISAPSAGTLTFQNLFNMEANGTTTGADGMVLEISINNGLYADIIAAGGSFVTGGYTHTIATATGSPIAGRMAWSGLSGGTTAAPTYITTTVNLPPAASGQPIQLKWRVATDAINIAPGAAGVRIDDVMIIPATCGPKHNDGPDRVLGDGSIPTSSGVAGFGLNVRNMSSGLIQGFFDYNDSGANVKLTNSTFSSLVITGTHAQFKGASNLASGGTVNFTVDVDDFGNPGTLDTISLALSNGYSASGNLITGGLKIQ